MITDKVAVLGLFMYSTVTECGRDQGMSLIIPLTTLGVSGLKRQAHTHTLPCSEFMLITEVR